MKKFFHDHSLSIFLGSLWIVLTVLAFTLTEGPVQSYLHNLAGDAFGAFIIVLSTKWLIERGSAESKDT
jgi:hypothetical protein